MSFIPEYVSTPTGPLWPEVWRWLKLTREGTLTLILDSTAPETGCDDMFFIPDKNKLVIPTLYSSGRS